MGAYEEHNGISGIPDWFIERLSAYQRRVPYKDHMRGLGEFIDWIQNDYLIDQASTSDARLEVGYGEAPSRTHMDGGVGGS